MKQLARLIVLLISCPTMAFATIQLGQDVTLSAFADAQLLWGEGGQNSGFTLNDGALYVGRNHQNNEFLIDLAFSGTNVPNPNNIPNVNRGGASPSNLMVSDSKTQVYIGHKYANSIFWRVGQFDGLYGYEANDTRELFFSNQGQ